MSIHLQVGVLGGCEPEDEPFFRHYTQQFQKINLFLRSMGLAEHDEPAQLPDGGFLRSITSEMYPFRRYALEVEQQLGIRFPHLLSLRGENAIYLPIPFNDVLTAPPAFELEPPQLGSSYRLFDECRILACILGIADDIMDTSAPDVVTQEIYHALGIDSIFPQNLPRIAHERPGEQWPLGAGGCFKMYEAAKYSVEHRAALVIC